MADNIYITYEIYDVWRMGGRIYILCEIGEVMQILSKPMEYIVCQ